jgi:hypothetical protein
LALLAACSRSADLLVWGASLGLALASVALRETGEAVLIASGQGPCLGLAEWLQALRASDQVRVAVLRVARRSASVGSVMQALSARYPELRMARYARSHLLLMAAAESAPELSALIAGAAGTLADVWLSPPCLGRESIGLARAARVLPDELHETLNPTSQVHVAASLVTDFKRAFPGGTWLDLVAGHGTLDPRSLPSDLLADFLRQVHAASRQRDHEVRGGLPFDLAAYAPGGQASLVFVVSHPMPGFAEFRARVRRASLHASFYAEPFEPADAPPKLSLAAAQRNRARS